MLQPPKASSTQWWCCISLLESREETCPFHFMYLRDMSFPLYFIYKYNIIFMNMMLIWSVQQNFFGSRAEIVRTVHLPMRQEQPIQFPYRLSLCLLSQESLLPRPFWFLSFVEFWAFQHRLSCSIFSVGKGFWTLEWVYLSTLQILDYSVPNPCASLSCGV